ncbi:hypothetical protein [Lapillicoccus jejuensis]|uniref:Uncharacterized protein n=1 Tax=Lapillicoccus jejuensis TaxID=402171 RepID=A0A542DWQ2_9MICO|nr:hypothetical protein [Lapillicoccus jejuensis]TQJ07344.1 hypothetical protein FB458_0405 [Lapillicoccus jejuensis]
MSPTIPSPESDLHDRLGGALPESYPGVDLDAVLASGRRTVRRRRVGALVAGVAAAAVVAVGATQLVTGPPKAAPQPAQSVTTRSATLTIGEFTDNGTQQGDTTYVVTLSPMDASTYKVDYATKGPNGTVGIAGSAVDLHDRRTTWGNGDGSRFIIGLVPSERAQPRQLVVRADRDYGGESSDVEPIPGTGYSAFVVGFEKPLVGDTPVRDVWWFDVDGRPVDKDGRAGASASIDGHTLWLAPDDSQFGDLSVGYTSTSGRPAGSVPVLATGRGDGGSSATITSWQVSALLPAGARTGSFLLGDGRTLAFTAVPLGADHSVAHVSPKDVGSQPLKVTSVTWTDAAGTTRTAPTP